MELLVLAIKVFILGVAAASGLALGYYAVNIALTYVATRIAHASARQQLQAHKKEAEEAKVEQSLCLRCKRNPRPEKSLHCRECQYL